MKKILMENRVWELIEGTRTSKETDIKKDSYASAYLFQGLPEDLQMQVAGCETAKEIWDSLKSRFIRIEDVQQAHSQQLKSKFKKLVMKEDESINSFAEKMMSIITKAATCGLTFDEQTKVRKSQLMVVEMWFKEDMEVHPDGGYSTLYKAWRKEDGITFAVKYKELNILETRAILRFIKQSDRKNEGPILPEIQEGDVKALVVYLCALRKVYDMKFELNEVEERSKHYPSTISFLSLLNSLIAEERDATDRGRRDCMNGNTVFQNIMGII
nr:zinc finger, CCHC-type [Tanacetum cinerariifolium]